MKKDSKSKEMIQSEKRGSTRLLMMVLSLSVLVGSITADSVNPVLPLISKALEASKSQVSWIVSGIALVLAIGVPIYGRISDFFELRKLYIFAIMILASGSLLCAIAPNLPLLVLGRMVQGAGMSAIPVLSVIAISKVFPQGKRGGALGIIAGSIGVGTAAGPIFGGVVGQYLGWNALFWFTFLLAIMIVIGAYYALPTIKPAESVGSNKNFDFIGGLFLGLTVGLLLFGITQGETSGFSSFSSLTSLIGSVVALVGFIWRIVTAENPFVPPVLFNNKDYVNTV
ncbi:MFS transporter, partial [Escherichia coli]|nr:MFS transporter [Escherichia coli]